jgi:hypothetical protein
MRRAISLVLAGVLVIAIVVAVVVSRSGGGSKPSHLRVVHGVIGSEKQPFFDDPKVKAAFNKAGFDVQVDTAGSQAMATSIDLSKYDFAFPAGTPAAIKIQKARRISQTYVPFFTPMAVASFKSIANLLSSAGVAHQTANGWTLDMKAFMALTARNARWTDLKNNTTYPVSKSILITSTDISTSNSAAMYAANGQNVVASPAQVQTVIPAVEPLFIRQGFAESSSEAPFDDYLSIGVGKTPLVMIYEAQFVDKAAQRDGSITSNMVLLYPDPDILSKHTLVPLTPAGDEIGHLLTNDPTLQQLAIDHGFRTNDRAAFQRFVQDKHVEVAPDVLDIIEPPTYETLQAMITEISKALHGTAAARLGG